MAKVQIPVKCSVKVKDKEYVDSVYQIDLDQHIDTHHSMLIYIMDTSQGADSDDFFDPAMAKDFLGETLTVTIAPSEGDDAPSKFVGVITQFALVNSVDSTNTIRITAASPTVLMDGAQKYESFESMTSSEAIEKAAKGHKITIGNIASTPDSWDYLLQHNETDWAFCRRLATTNGLFCYYDGEKLYVREPNTSTALTLTFRQTLGSFSLGVGIEQPNFSTVVYSEVENKELRPDSKQVSKSRSLGGVGSEALKASENNFSTSSLSRLGIPGMSAGDADKIVDRERSRAIDRMLDCEGTSIVPGLKVGMTVKIDGLGRSSGSYYITAVYHRVSDGGLYENTFQCRPVDAAFPQQAPLPPSEAGLHRAIVEDNNDPQKLGRVKVKTAWFPQVPSIWLRVVSPYAGNNYGWYVLPEIGDEVLVGYLHGDFQQQVILGSFYHKDAAPSDEWTNDNNEIKVFHTMAGNIIKLTDTAGEEEITISTVGEQNSVVFSNKDKSITVKTDGDLNLTADGNIVIDAQQDITLKAQGKINAEAMGAVSMKSSSGDAALEGLNVEVKAQAAMKASGSATAEVSSSGQTTVKGSIVMIN